MKYQVDENNCITAILFMEDVDVELDCDINFGVDKYINGAVIKGERGADYGMNYPSYERLVDQRIRNKYTVSEELALLRQRDAKVSEFAEYNAFCEACKAEARAEVLSRDA